MIGPTKTSIKPLMPAIYDDEGWELGTGKDVFKLSGSQVKALKQATEAGQRGLVWFDGFSISIPHIVFIRRLKLSPSVIDKKRIEFAKKFGSNY